ncbi:unnamed protein product [Lactuca saligna]|uniref:Uncharacterized protein n=1 Tax=Lactuca saligna TaxID=75948 RepID=A0AA35V4P7_LACSI|nr:unnamed protein product [Lactuca saligna]
MFVAASMGYWKVGFQNICYTTSVVQIKLMCLRGGVVNHITDICSNKSSRKNEYIVKLFTPHSVFGSLTPHVARFLSCSHSVLQTLLEAKRPHKMVELEKMIVKLFTPHSVFGSLTPHVARFLSCSHSVLQTLLEAKRPHKMVELEKMNTTLFCLSSSSLLWALFSTQDFNGSNLCYRRKDLGSILSFEAYHWRR